MSTSTIRLSIITVNYNGLGDTCAMIRSLGDHLTGPCELIVVDNGSTRDEAAELRRRFPGITVLRSERNLGFAGGNNLGIAAATGQYVLLLNNDTYVTDGSLGHLCDTLDANPDMGAVSPKIRFAADPQPIQFAGYTPLSAITLRNRLIGFNHTDDGSYDTPHDTPYAHGAAMMVRRETIDRAGLMPELYFLYYEELDWSARITRAGYRIGYDPGATVFHRESRSTGTDSPLKVFYLTRNRLLFAWRNRNGIVRPLAILYQLAVAGPKNAAAWLVRRRPDLARATVRGVTAFFRIPHKTA
ncbi:MAG: glycosyltransferase [Rikenellaceae bacterium]|nr:glycosyltransferase [Rikenellaceae bacterium]